MIIFIIDSFSYKGGNVNIFTFAKSVSFVFLFTKIIYCISTSRNKTKCK